jgi:hypothetical protein
MAVVQLDHFAWLMFLCFVNIRLEGFSALTACEVHFRSYAL